jgi:hypothetical protein
MAYLIKVGTDNKVKRVVVGSQEFLANIVDQEAGQWIVREENVGTGFNYDSTNDIFYPPRPYPSWKLDSNWTWQPPKAKPIDKDIWNEDRKVWQTREDYETYNLQKPYTEAVQEVLDTQAQELGYENILSACSYSGYENPFKLESESFIVWRGAVWATCYQILGEVLAETRVMPTIDELLAELPIKGE